MNFRPSLETLEYRTVLSTLTLRGGGQVNNVGQANWSDPANWRDGGQVAMAAPGFNDTAVLDAQSPTAYLDGGFQDPFRLKSLRLDGYTRNVSLYTYTYLEVFDPDPNGSNLLSGTGNIQLVENSYVEFKGSVTTWSGITFGPGINGRGSLYVTDGGVLKAEGTPGYIRANIYIGEYRGPGGVIINTPADFTIRDLSGHITFSEGNLIIGTLARLNFEDETPGNEYYPTSGGFRASLFDPDPNFVPVIINFGTITNDISIPRVGQANYRIWCSEISVVNYGTVQQGNMVDGVYSFVSLPTRWSNYPSLTNNGTWEMNDVAHLYVARNVVVGGTGVISVPDMDSREVQIDYIANTNNPNPTHFVGITVFGYLDLVGTLRVRNFGFGESFSSCGVLLKPGAELIIHVDCYIQALYPNGCLSSGGAIFIENDVTLQIEDNYDGVNAPRYSSYKYIEVVSGVPEAIITGDFTTYIFDSYPWLPICGSKEGDLLA